MSNQLLLVYALIFGAVLLAIQGLYVALVKDRGDRQKINRRLALTKELANPSQVLEILRKERGVDALDYVPALQGFKELVVQSGVRFTPQVLFFKFALPAVAFYFVISYALDLNLLAVPLAVLAAIAWFYLSLHRARRKRIAKFSDQLPEALDVIVRGLRAGHPFRVALALVASEMPDPAGTEFGIIADEITFGLEQSTAVQNLAPRVGHDDLAFFSTAVNIQQQTGGNLGEILSRLSKLLRSRAKLRLKIRSLSAEGRMSAIVLSLTPFILFGVITLLSPDFFFSVKDHPIIMPLLFLGLFMLVVGNFIMYRMVNFKF
jgi:tight adherence protein B